jgi:predicted membrane protein
MILQKILKTILSILFLLCLLQMPYGYYQTVRFAGMVGFALLAFFAYEQNRKAEVIIYVCLALLFQPFIKIALGRMIWNVVDVLVAIGLIPIRH